MRKEWHAHLLGFTHSKRNGSTYNCRRIEIEPKTKMLNLVKDISEGYTMGAKSKLGKYTDVREYDGTCNATTVYRICEENPDIEIELDALFQGIASSDVESAPLEMKAQAYVLCGSESINGEEHQIKLISMNTPIASLKNRFFHDKGKFWEIPSTASSLMQSGLSGRISAPV